MKAARTACSMVLLLAAAVVAGCSDRATGTPARAPGPPAVPVTVAEVVQKDVPVQVTAVGNVQAYTTVSVKSQIAGQVLMVGFREGQDVRKGDVLFTIDPRPLQAALRQAQANVVRDTAQLRQAEAALVQRRAEVQQAEANVTRDLAQLENARAQERRYRELVEKEFVAREQYEQFRTNAAALEATVQADRAAVENAKAAVRAAEAQIENARAAIKADEAMVESAKLQLGYTEIRAPIEGRTGNVLIQRGNVVKANDVGNPMVVITRVHPIYVSFSVPEQQLDEIKRHREAGDLKVEATVAGQARAVRGELSFVNNTVDVATGTIQLKATFQNNENALWPGQFVNIALTLTTQPRALVVPSQAIQRGQQGPYLFVVKPDLTVEQRVVQPGIVDGRDVVIVKGVAAGERVVTDGQLRLVPGARVEIKTSAAPTAPGLTG
jgi:multidrug efflux system membrane fusion protein